MNTQALLKVLRELRVERTASEWAGLVHDLLLRFEESVGQPVIQGALFTSEEKENCNCRVKVGSLDAEPKTEWEGVLYAGRTKQTDSLCLVILFPFIQGKRVAPTEKRDQFVEFQFVTDESNDAVWVCNGWVSDDYAEWRQIEKPGDLYIE